MKSYIVIIGDIEHSRKLPGDERKQVQKKLESVFRKLNRASGHIISPYTITLGDEFQAVYESAGDIFQHIWTIMATVHPIYVRMSIGVGEITTEMKQKNALGMDGPAFHKAREQLLQMKENKLLLSVAAENEGFSRLVNNSFRILDVNLRSWKKNRFTILQKLYEGKEVKQIAKDTGLSEVAVYKNINAGTLEAIRGLCDSISEIIEEML
ncbi:MAG: SatD family protein [Balneolaceae bacterium]